MEDRLGHGRYLFFYLLCGVAATFAHAAIHFDSKIPMVGASGAIAGVLGAYLVQFPRARIKTILIIIIFVKIIRLPAYIVLIYWISLQLLSAYAEYGNGIDTSGGIAWFAHIGGFFSGLILVMVMKKRKRRSRLKLRR